MNSYESMQLLALIKLAYPNSYRDLDKKGAAATANMWERSFAEVPYSLMEQAFDTLRMKLKFPPTVAEMAEQLRAMHYEACEIAQIHRTLGNRETERRFIAVAKATEGYKDWPKIDSFGHGNYAMIGGDQTGTSGNWLDRADRVPFLDAGGV